MFLFLESNTRDNLEQMRKEIADINEKLDTLEEKKLRMEGKIYSFSGGRGAALGQEKVNWVNGFYLFRGMIFVLFSFHDK